MRRFAPYLAYLGVAAAATWLTDSWAMRLTFVLGPILLLDQYVFRLLPWRPPTPAPASLLPRAALLVALAGLAYFAFHPIFRWTETLFMALLIGVGLSMLASLGELGLAVVGRWRKAEKPGSGAAVVLAVGIVLAGVAVQPLLTFHPFHSAVLATPYEYQIPCEDVTVVTPDGLSLAGWYMPCPDAAGSAIFCHGYGGNRGQVLHVVSLLKQHKFNILAFDFRGHGDSPGRTAAFGALEYQDVMGAEAFLRQRAPGKPVLLFGSSYGASVALQSLSHLKDVKAAWVESGFARLSDMAVHKFGMVPEGVRGPVLQFYNAAMWLDSGFTPLDVNPIDAIKNVRTPIGFCHGTADDLVFFREGEDLWNAYQGPKEHYWIEGAGHGALRNVAGLEYDALFAKFVAKYVE